MVVRFRFMDDFCNLMVGFVKLLISSLSKSKDEDDE